MGEEIIKIFRLKTSSKELVTADEFAQIVCEMKEAFRLSWRVFGIHCIKKNKEEGIN